MEKPTGENNCPAKLDWIKLGYENEGGISMWNHRPKILR